MVNPGYPKHIEARIAEYATHPNVRQLAAELGMTPERLRQAARRRCISRLKAEDRGGPTAKVLAYLNSRNGSKAEIQAATGLQFDQVVYAIRELEKSHRVERVGETERRGSRGNRKSVVFGLSKRVEQRLAAMADDPLVTDPVVNRTVPAPAVAEDVRAVLAKQPALAEVWR